MSENIPKVSIVLPVYNGEKTIENCIQSIRNQTVSEWVLIIINDGSKDATGDILDRYALLDTRIKVFHRKNKGVSKSRNFAISKIETPFFVCVDSDDYVFPNYLEELLEAKKIYPNVGHIWSGFQTVLSQQQKEGEKHLLSSNEKYSFYDRKDVLFLYSSWMIQSPCNKLYDTKIVHQNSIKMDENLSLGEDFLFNLRYMDILNNKKILFINEATYNYVRSDNDSLDHKYRENLLEIYINNDIVFERYLNKWKIEDKEIFINGCFYHYENIMKNTFHDDNEMSFYKKIIFNNKILKSERYKEIYKNKTCNVNKLYEKAYQSQNYLFIYFLDLILKLIKN